MSILMWMGLLITIAAVIGVPLRLAAKPPIKPQTLSRLTVLLLWSAGILSGLMTLITLAAAAGGMDTRVPWGLGVYMYLIPALFLGTTFFKPYDTIACVLVSNNCLCFRVVFWRSSRTDFLWTAATLWFKRYPGYVFQRIHDHLCDDLRACSIGRVVLEEGAASKSKRLTS